MAVLTDDSIMPWGIHKGKKMANVPAEYLIWLIDNNKCGGDVKKYIEDNKSTMQKEINYNKKQKR